MEVRIVELTQNGKALLHMTREYAKDLLEEEFSPYMFSNDEINDFLSFASQEYTELPYPMPEEEVGYAHMREAGVVRYV